MARRKKRSGRRSKKIPVAATAGVAVGAYQAFKAVTAASDKGDAALQVMTGFSKSGTFAPNNLFIFWVPTLAGIAGSKAASKFGLNRAISNIPWFKI